MIDLALIALPNPALTNPKMYFPLSLLYLAAVAKKASHSVELVDMRAGLVPLPEAQYYGFSCTTPEITEAKRLALQVKGKTIVGGAHPSLLPSDCAGYFDYIVKGEGESILPLILRGQYQPSLIDEPRIKDLDSIPYPAWDMVSNPFSEELYPGERYGKGALAATLIASRGCPYDCAFCANIYRTPVVYRSVENIIGEVRELVKRGVRHFRFEDDNFTLHPDFTKLCVELYKLEIHYKCHTRSNLLDEDTAMMLKMSGCDECGLGVESADPDVLRINNKRELVGHHANAIAILRWAGIRSKTYMIAGLPGETEKTNELNMKFFMENKPDKWTLSTFTPYPGSDIYNHPSDYDIDIINPDWTKWWNFADGYNHILKGQTQTEMWTRYLTFYNWLRRETWKIHNEVR